MKVALLVEPSWLMREQTTLRRLMVALVDEQVRLVLVAPSTLDPESTELSLSGASMRYDAGGWRWLRDWRIGRLRRELASQEVDVVHALSATLERAALRMGERLGAPVLVSVWSAAGAMGLSGGGQTPVVYAAATPALADMCRARVTGGARVELVPPGVYASGDETLPPPLDDPQHPPSFLVVGDGRADPAYQALLQGMAKIKPRLGGAMYFFYAVGSQQHQLWLAAESLGLQEQVSWVPVGGASRELLVQADVVVQPQAPGVVRTMVLEAMRTGRPIIATEDPVLDYLIEGQTARLLDRPTASDWADALLTAITDRERLVSLGASASAYVRDHYPASRYSTAMLDLYRSLSPEAIPFQA